MKTRNTVIFLLLLSVAIPCHGVVIIQTGDGWSLRASDWFAPTLSLDLNGDHIVDLVFNTIMGGGALSPQGGSQFLMEGGFLLALTEGTEIGSNSAVELGGIWGGDEQSLAWLGLIFLQIGGDEFNVPPNPTQGNFIDNRAYVGVAFDMAGATHYGWLDVKMTSDAAIMLYGWGYETEPGVSLFAGPGAVPEPATTVLILAGGALLAMRKKTRTGINLRPRERKIIHPRKRLKNQTL